MASQELLLRVAKLKFEDGSNNSEIAEILLNDGTLETESTAQRKVGELVEEAGQWLLDRHKLLASMEMNDTLEHNLAKELCSKYRLLDARVVPGGEIHSPLDYVALLKKYARAAADYFDAYASAAEDQGKQLHVSVSGGQPILDMVSSLTDRKRTNVFYYATGLVGRGSRPQSPHVGSEANATVAWARSGRLPNHLYYATIQPYEIWPDDLHDPDKQKRHDTCRKMLLEQMHELADSEYVKEVLEEIHGRINVAFAGLGIPHASGVDVDYGMAHVERLTMTGLLKPLGIDLGLLVAEGAVGDFSYILFDKDGKTRDSWSFFITAGYPDPLDFYQTMVEKREPVIAIAGVRKEAAIVPALKARLLNVLITDAVTAEKLLA